MQVHPKDLVVRAHLQQHHTTNRTRLSFPCQWNSFIVSYRSSRLPTFLHALAHVVDRTVTDMFVLATVQHALMRRVLPSHIVLQGSEEVTDASLAAIKSVAPAITELILRNLPHVTTKGVVGLLGSCSVLNVINISYCQAVSASVSNIMLDLEQLTSIKISHMFDLTNENVAHMLQTHRSLSTLQIKNCPSISEPAFEFLPLSISTLHLENLPRVQDDLVSVLTTASLSGQSSLGAFPNLTSLSLAGCCNLTDDGVVGTVLLCPTLLTLNLDQCYIISDASLRAIGSNCLDLTCITLNDCINVTDVGLLEMARSILHLQHVELSNCSGVSQACIDNMLGSGITVKR
eukprot:m.276290 g.276290  ORF g.276290 m.276290 type:complete len:346 (+) comp15712_c0_seq7:700-1737(+)